MITRSEASRLRRAAPRVSREDHPLLSLNRERVGTIRLAGLEAGRTRPMTRNEREQTIREGKARRRI